MKNKSLAQLSFLCFGAGAIGTYIAGSLALNNQKVVFVERPEVAEKLRKSGLILHLKDGKHHVAAPEIVTSIDEALTKGPFDVAILAIKSFDTVSLLQTLLPYQVALPPILCVQNGVENEMTLANTLGKEKVIPGTVTTAIGRRGPGEIVVEKLRGLGVASDHILTPTLVAVLDAAGLRARQYRKPADMKWSKLLTNLLANASSAILDMTPAAIYAHPGLCKMEIDQLRETLQVMSAQGIQSINLPGTPVQALSWLVRYLPLSISQSLLIRFVGTGRGAKMPSFHIDLYSGFSGKSEVDYYNGAVVRFGEKLGIPTPVNHLLNKTLLALSNGEIDKSTYAHQPEKLLALLNKNEIFDHSGEK